MVKESGTDTKKEDSPSGGEAGGTTDTSKQRENS